MPVSGLGFGHILRVGTELEETKVLLKEKHFEEIKVPILYNKRCIVLHAYGNVAVDFESQISIKL